MTTRARLAGALGLFLLILAAGCAEPTPLYAPHAALGGVLVHVYQADFDDERVRLKMFVTNQTDTAFEVDRDGMALRLTDGRTLRRAPPAEPHRPTYILTPGETRSVEVDFRGDDLDDLDGAALIVGGVRVGTDTSFRVVGEVGLTRIYTPHTVIGAPPAPSDDASPSLASAASKPSPLSVAVDASRLSAPAGLPCAITTHLLREGFALVPLGARATVTIDLVEEGDGLRVEGSGPGGDARRRVPAAPTEDAHQAVAQQIAELARELARPRPEGP